MDLIDLSDDDLHSELRAYYPNIGPVVDSTRGLYKKMLIKAREEGANPAVLAPRIITRNKSDEDNLQDETAQQEQDESSDNEDIQLAQIIDAAEITESAYEEMDLTEGASCGSFRKTVRVSRIAVEDEEQDNFFRRALIIGIAVVIVSVGALYVLRAVTDY